MKNALEEVQIILGSIIVGIPVGVFVAIYWFYKFPFLVYSQAKVGLINRRVLEAKRVLKANKEDIWEKHIKRMEEKKYDN